MPHHSGCPRGPSNVMTNCLDVNALQDGVPEAGGTIRGCRRQRREHHQPKRCRVASHDA